MYSLDFDEAYLREEEILSAVTSIYDENGFYRCPVRLPGTNLPSVNTMPCRMP